MLQLIKKSEAQVATAPHWHPNFRNFERLPDTKVVRTTFFVNVTAITVAACMVMILGYRIYRVTELNAQIAESRAVIDKNAKENAEAIKRSKDFADEEKKLAEASLFSKRAIVPSEFLLLLGSTLPKVVQIESSDLRFSGASGDQCVLRGIVAGSRDEASGSANKYVEVLRTTPGLSAKFTSVEIASLNPDPTGGFLRFEIVLKFQPAGKEKKS